MYARFSSLVPKPLFNAFKQQLIYNNIEMNPYKFTGFVFIYGFFLALGVSFNAFLFLEIPLLIGFGIFFLLFVGGSYLYLKMKSEAKGAEVEKVLPDALRLVASNMKSGLTTEKALFVAGRPEFGPLQIELMNASKKIASGEKVEFALKGMADNINSPVFKKTMWLISQGIKSGGQIADLLFQLSDDLKNQGALDEEISSNISIYILLILFAAIAGAPLLFGISSFIVEILTKQMALTSTADISSIPVTGNMSAIKGFLDKGSGETLAPDFIMNFSMIMLIFTTVFSALTIGVINNGKETAGLKYVLPMIIGAFLLFFGVRFILLQVFGSLL